MPKVIAKHLLDVETLTKEDIYEIVETNKLGWWEKKKAKAALEAQRLAELPDEEPKEETVEESTLEDVSDEDTAQQQKEEPKN